jgi:hypothetical protein
VAKSDNIKLVNDFLNESFVMGTSFQEEEVKLAQPEVYEAAIAIYGNWKRTLKEHALTREKIKERDKFNVYCIMKRRVDRFGEGVLRPKNIESELKEKIQETFHTVRSLKEVILSWSEKKVLYEARIYELTGGSLDDLRFGHPELFEKVERYFQDMDQFKETMKLNFGVFPVIAAEIRESMQEIDPSSVSVEFLQRIGYLSDTEVKQIMEAKQISASDVLNFLYNMTAEHKISGNKITEPYLKSQEPVMYLAIKLHFDDLQNAYQKLTERLMQGSMTYRTLTADGGVS